MNLRSKAVFDLLSSVVFASLSVTLWSMPASPSIPDVPKEYVHLFAQYADNRPLYERALNSIDRTVYPGGRSFALIAGVTEYPNFPQLLQSLKPADADIVKLEDYLKEEEFFDQIVVLKDTDVTLENLRFFLQVYFPEQLNKSPHSRFLFAYSGHGYSNKSAGENRGYLLTTGAKDLTDPVNRIDLHELRDMLHPVIDSAEKVLVLINSCDSGAFLDKGAFGPGPNPLTPGAKSAYAILASRADQRSWADPNNVGPGSIFFEAILKGLGGAADKSPADGVVTFYELDTYLHEQIPLLTNERQRPTEGDISRTGSEGEGFFFLNRSKQITLRNAPPWNPKDAIAFGEQTYDLLERAGEAYENEQYAEALRLLTQAAAAGDGDAMAGLVQIYAEGDGVAPDPNRARQWAEKGVAAGSNYAMEALGEIYLQGLGTTRDAQLAIYWLEKGANAGNAKAMLLPGSVYEFGLGGLTKNPQLGRQWYEKAAAAGNSDAALNLGTIYMEGLGTPTNYVESVRWYEKAAAAGQVAAMLSLVEIYAKGGHGIAKNDQRSHYWDVRANAASDAINKWLAEKRRTATKGAEKP